MPENRPRMVVSYIYMDDEHFYEVSKLHQAVVVHPTFSINFSIVDNIAELAAQTKLVKEHEVTISKIAHNKFIIFLPIGLAPDRFIKAVPFEVWELGFLFQIWELRSWFQLARCL